MGISGPTACVKASGVPSCDPASAFTINTDVDEHTLAMPAVTAFTTGSTVMALLNVGIPTTTSILPISPICWRTSSHVVCALVIAIRCQHGSPPGVVERAMVGSLSWRENLQEREIVAEMTRDQEIASYVLSGRSAHAMNQAWVVQQVSNPERRAFH